LTGPPRRPKVDAQSLPKEALLAQKEDWERLTGGAYVGGAVRETDEHGRLLHRRIALVQMDNFSIAFRFDRVAARDQNDPSGTWTELPLKDNDYMWYPWPMMPVAFDGHGVARPGSDELPSYIDGIYPKSALPADAPPFAKQPAN
jgi:hypothetical protein